MNIDKRNRARLMGEREFTREQVSELFGFSVRTVRRRIEGGQLPTAGNRGERKRHRILLSHVRTLARREGRDDVLRDLSAGKVSKRGAAPSVDELCDDVKSLTAAERRAAAKCIKKKRGG